MKKEMFNFTWRPLALFAIATCGGFANAACGVHSPAGPDPTLPITLKVSGPASVAPGTVAHFRAQLVSLDLQHTQDISARAEWASSDSQLVEIRGNGDVYARDRGEANILAKYDGQVYAAHTLLLEDGTFKMTGRVVDSSVASSRLGIARASIEVLDGIGAGLRATSNDTTGDYTLYGVAGIIRLGVSANGYASTSVDVAVNTADGRTIALTAIGTPDVDLSGTWTLTFVSGSNCTGLPDAVRSRDYTARFTWTGFQQFEAQLTGPGGTVSERLVGRIVGREMTWSISHYPGDVVEPPYYALLDPIQPKGFLGIWGTVKATIVEPVTIGSLEGGFDYYPNQVTTGTGLTCLGPGGATLRREGT